MLHPYLPPADGDSNKVGMPESRSRRSSASSSSSNDQAPLLDASEQTQSRFRTTSVSPADVFREGFTFARRIFQVREQRQSKDGRHIGVQANRTNPLVDERTGKPYVRNWIRSNRYTLWTFLPLQLIAQFSKLANFYFLCFAILQLIPGLSTIGNKTNIVPLSVFVSISMAKEGYDDYRRHRLDKKENQRETMVAALATRSETGLLHWKKVQWRSLSVGDIIKVKRDEPIPADIVLLRSNGLTESGITYVETTALDGETSLKRKRIVKSVAEACATPEGLVACSVEFVIEDPNPNLSTFRGRVIVDDRMSPLTNDNIIYRGSILRSNPEISALVVYSGEECKIRLNASGNRNARLKAPNLQSMVNKVVILVVCIVVGLSVYNTLAYQFWKRYVESKHFYLSSAAVPFHHELFGFIIMFATMVPLSLYVSMEMIKLAQIYFLNVDVDMYDERSDTPFEARTSTINEDLGQVAYIFSDKTGTLTDNQMEFRKLYVAGTEWIHDHSEPSYDAANGFHSSASARPSKMEPVAKGNTVQLVNYIAQRSASLFTQRARLLLLCIALCHSGVPELTQNGTAIDFQASSPDEIALLRAAQDMGFLMRSRDHDSITLALSSPHEDRTSTETYEILNEIEFSSHRKRMSIIVRLPDGRICIICKGADSVIVERLRIRRHNMTSRADVRLREQHQKLAPLYPRHSMPKDDENISIPDDISVGDDQSDVENCIKSVNRFANESLRTLLYAYRFLHEKEYYEWRKTWDAAITSLSDREKLIESAGELIEVDLELAGATGIEDKLQQGVPESIDKLCRADIKIWMLTGDKLETAINIGHSCGLIRENSTVSILTAEKGRDELEDTINSLISTTGRATHSVIAVDGSSLTTILNEPSGLLEALFFRLVILADSVICCRAQPSQKAQLVSGIRNRLPNSVTLAVGDGANDIAMIQEAHIGIGITGKEGLQAARSSDYSIAQFRFLPKLILVHGRWNYIRTCKYVLGTLWKEVVFYLTQALFQRSNGFTGTSLYEPWTLTNFNTLFTSLSVMVIGIFEKDLSASTLLTTPELYKSMGPKNRGFDYWIYFGWTAMAVAESMTIYFSMLYLFASEETARDNSLFSMGDLDFVAVVLVISIKLQVIEMHNKSIVAFLSMFLSAGAAFLWNIILAAVYPIATPYRARGAFFNEFGRNLTWWLTLIFIVTCVYLLEFSVSALRKAFFATDADVFQELERDMAHKQQFGEVAVMGSQEMSDIYKDGPIEANDEEDIELEIL
jgi:phospholipid-translocating ATPase